MFSQWAPGGHSESAGERSKAVLGFILIHEESLSLGLRCDHEANTWALISLFFGFLCTVEVVSFIELFFGGGDDGRINDLILSATRIVLYISTPCLCILFLDLLSFS